MTYGCDALRHHDAGCFAICPPAPAKNMVSRVAIIGASNQIAKRISQLRPSDRNFLGKTWALFS